MTGWIIAAFTAVIAIWWALAAWIYRRLRQQLQVAAALLNGRITHPFRGWPWWLQVEGAWNDRAVEIRVVASPWRLLSPWRVRIAMRPLRVPGRDGYWPTPSTSVAHGVLYYNPRGSVWMGHAELGRLTPDELRAVFEDLQQAAEQVERGQ